MINVKDEPSVFLSYARKDGAQKAKTVREQLEAAGIPVWQDRANLEGGVGWWNQITEALDKVDFLVLVMTPGALESFATTRKEWQYARQQGVKVYPIKGAPDDALNFPTMPKWMRKSHFFDLDHEWDTFLNYLKSPPDRVRVPFMAPDLPNAFVDRPEEFNQLLEHLLSGDRQNPIAITTALIGAGGFGKTTLAAALCHNDDVITAFDDGILWVALGEKPNVTDAVGKLYTAVTGDTVTFKDDEDAARRFAEKIAYKNCLIVIDDVWNVAHLRPLLRGGKDCARLVTTRNLECVLEANAETRRVNVDQMKVSEAVRMLVANLDTRITDLQPFEELAKRLGEWPLLLGLVNGALRERINVRHDRIDGALRHINQTLDRRGLGAFDRNSPVERNDAVNKSIEVSIELLDADQRRHYYQAGIFPEDTDIPLATLSALWSVDEFDAQELAELLDKFSLLKLNLELSHVRLHDVLRTYISSQLPDASAAHQKLLEAWDKLVPSLDPYAFRNAAYHLKGANRLEDLRRLLTDYSWLELKINATDYNALIADYDYFPYDSDLQLIQGAIRLSSHIADKSQLPSQLHGRLLRQSGQAIKDLLQSTKPRTPWLRPTKPTLTPPGGPLIRTLKGHWDVVNAVAMTPDGRHIVSGSADKTLKIWDLCSGELLHSIDARTGLIGAVAVTPDGKHAVSCSDDSMLKVWEIQSGSLQSLIVDAHTGLINAVAVTPDGCRVVSGSEDNTLKLWDIKSGQLLHVFDGHTGSVNTVAITQNGKYVVSGADDSTLRMWDLESRQLLRTMNGHRSHVSAVAVTPDGRHAVSASLDSTLKVWDLESGSLLRTIKGQTEYFSAVCVIPDCPWAVSSSDETLKVWDLESGRLLRTLVGHAASIHAVAISPNGRRIASGSLDGTIKIWDMASRELPRTVDEHAGPVSAVAVMPTGTHAVSGSGDNTLKVWDITSGELLRTIETHGYLVNAVSATPTDSRVISGGDDMILKVWCISSGKLLYRLNGHTDWIRAVAVSPKRKYIISGSDDKKLKVWNFRTGRQLRTLRGHMDSVIAVAVTPDEDYIISGSADCSVKIWHIESGILLRTLDLHSDAVGAVAVTSDGRYAISGSRDYTLKVWNIASGRLLHTIEGHSGWVNAVAVMPNGQHAVSTSSDSTIKLWDIWSGRLVASFAAEADVNCCAVRADGVDIVAGDALGRVHFLRFEQPDPAAPPPTFRLL